MSTTVIYTNANLENEIRTIKTLEAKLQELKELKEEKENLSSLLWTRQELKN